MIFVLMRTDDVRSDLFYSGLVGCKIAAIGKLIRFSDSDDRMIQDISETAETYSQCIVFVLSS